MNDGGSSALLRGLILVYGLGGATSLLGLALLASHLLVGWPDFVPAPGFGGRWWEFAVGLLALAASGASQLWIAQRLRQRSRQGVQVALLATLLPLLGYAFHGQLRAPVVAGAVLVAVLLANVWEELE